MGVASTTKALEIEKENPKALFRRGKCRAGINDLDAAKEDLVRAERLNPSDKAVKKEIQALKQKIQKQMAKEREQYAGMFDAKPTKVKESQEPTTEGAVGDSADNASNAG